MHSKALPLHIFYLRLFTFSFTPTSVVMEQMKINKYRVHCMQGPTTIAHTRLLTFSFTLVWPVTLAQVWTHYKIGKLNMWTLFCNVCIDFLNSQIWKEIMLELNGKPSSVTRFSTDLSFQNLVFWNLFEFSVAEITSKLISPTFWIQILPNKSH